MVPWVCGGREAEEEKIGECGKDGVSGWEEVGRIAGET